MQSLTVLAVLVLLLSVQQAAADYSSAALLDQVTSLPGADALTLGFNQFSGYLAVGQELTKNMVRQLFKI